MATIKQKILTNVLIAILIVAGIVGSTYFDLRKMQRLQDEGAKRAADAVTAKAAAMTGLALYDIIADSIINHDLQKSEKEWAAAKNHAVSLVDKAVEATDTAEERRLASEVKESVSKIIALYEGSMLPLLKNTDGLTSEIRGVDDQIDLHVAAIEERMDKVTKSVEKEMHDADAEFDALIGRVIAKGLIIGAIGILLQAGLAGWLMAQILKPVNSMVLLLKDMAEGEGDLTKRLDDAGGDEIAVASRWFNLFMGKIQQIISQVSLTSAQLASAAGQLRETADQIATGAEEVAAQTTMVATASEEMAATSADIATTCHNAADSAASASTAAEAGTTVVQTTVDGMHRIAKRVQEVSRTVDSLGSRSEQIGAIIGTIEDIADQTNLLALNAAIEAARAGEQGRGFAVVADEVRALAERTTRATKEISGMINSIQAETRAAVQEMERGVAEVEAGTVEAEKSGSALVEILHQINEVTAQVAQIATAAEEQTATTAEITNNIQQVTEVVQTTAKGATDSADAAASVNQVANELQSLVRKFRV